MNTKLKAFDFTRMICTLGIICYHFSCHTTGEFKPFYLHANGRLGTVFVTVFFILSGALLYKNNASDNFRLRVFYYKRWKSVFPSFYIAWTGFYILSVLLRGWNANKLNGNIIWTILGIDGYLKAAYGMETFYFIGEWFLGAIVICYLFMPVLIHFDKKYDLATTIIVLMVLIWSVQINLFKVGVIRNLITWLLCMQIGIVIIKRNIWKNKFFFFLSLLIALIINFFVLPISSSVMEILFGIALFIILSYVGDFVMQLTVVNKTISTLSKKSYCMYLLHHIIIVYVLKVLDINQPVIAGATLLLIMVLTIISGYALSRVTAWVLHLPVYKKIENLILK